VVGRQWLAGRGPGVYAYMVDRASGDLFIAFNGLSRTNFARLDPDTLPLMSWYWIGLFTPGPMLVFAGATWRANPPSAAATW
jgi:hypothetical protein